MDRCPKCGAITHAEDLFCGYCGFNIMEKQIAMEATQEAFKLSDIQCRLGIVHLKKKEYYKAIEKFKKTLSHDPENNQAQDLLAQAEQLLQETTENP